MARPCKSAGISWNRRSFCFSHQAPSTLSRSSLFSALALFVHLSGFGNFDAYDLNFSLQKPQKVKQQFGHSNATGYISNMSEIIDVHRMFVDYLRKH